MKQRPAIGRQRDWGKGALTLPWLGTTDPSNSDNLKATAVGGCVHVHVHEWVYECVCVHASVRDVFAIYDNVPGLTRIFFFKSSQNSPKPVCFGVVYHVNSVCIYIAKSCWLL